MLVIAEKRFASTTYGNISKGQVVDCSEAHAQHLIEHGLVKKYAFSDPVKKEQKQDPIPPAAAEQPGQSLPAGQALPTETALSSEDGGKKVIKSPGKRKTAKKKAVK